MIIFRN